MVLAISLTTTLQNHTPNLIIRGVMPWMNHRWYFAVTAVLTSFRLCDGQAVDAEAAVQRPQGSTPFSGVQSGVNHESAAPTRHGSLAFKFDRQDDLNSTHVLHNVMDAKLKRLDPSVQCSDNLMTLKVKRFGTHGFLVDSGERPLTPLSQMSSKCGFSVKRSRRDVEFSAPYDGCHVTQKDGDHVLPLRLWGAPMTMSCPAVASSPSVFCFPYGMVVKIGGVTANELKVKESNVWKSLLAACSSCALNVKVFSGALTLIVPYNRGLCVEIKDEEYLLSLLLEDVELLVTCPLTQNVKPTTAPVAPPILSGQVLQHPQYPVFPQYVVPPQTHFPAPTKGKLELLPRPQLPSGAAADSYAKNQDVSAAQHSAYPFMQQFPQYLLFPRPEEPAQTSATKNTAAPPVQIAQMPQSPQYQFPIFQQFPMMPGTFHPTTPSPLPATGTVVLVTTPAPTTKHKGEPKVPQQLPLRPPYSFLPFHKPALSPKEQTEAVQESKPAIQPPKQHHVYPPTYQIPVLYPSQRHNAVFQTAAPATSLTTSAATTQRPAAQNPFYHPHPYMPVYYAPQLAAMPVFPDLPTTPPTKPAPPDQHEEQTAYHVMPPLYPFLSRQIPKSGAKN